MASIWIFCQKTAVFLKMMRGSLLEQMNRCGWGDAMSLEEIAYHDERWCVPVHDDHELFAMLCLEGMQAGLSWSLILRRERDLRAAFDGFDPEVVRGYDEEKIEGLIVDERVIRNRRKIQSVITNAEAFERVVEEYGSFDSYIWGFTDGEVVMNHPGSFDEVPAESPLSREVSRDLKRRGFVFVGPVIIYSYLQGIGVINDHLESCSWKYH